MTKNKQIETEAEYKRILKRIEKIFDAEPETPEGDELETLVTLVEKYEAKQMIIHPGETLKEAMEDRNISTEELAQYTGFSSAYIKDVLNCKENISDEFARKLEDILNIDTDFWMKLNELYADELKAFEESQQV